MELESMYMEVMPVRVEDGIMYCGQPVLCRSLKEVSELPFVYKHLSEDQDQIFFRYIEEIGAHVVVTDPEPDMNSTVIAIANVIDPFEAESEVSVTMH
jgi:hypothetical protein